MNMQERMLQDLESRIGRFRTLSKRKREGKDYEKENRK
jgi:hypothetical protein